MYHNNCMPKHTRRLTQPLMDVSRLVHNTMPLAGRRARACKLPAPNRPTDRDREWTANPLLHLWYIKGTFWGREKLWRPPSLCVDEKLVHSKINQRWGQFASNALRKLRHVGAIVIREMSSSFQQHHHLFRAHGMIGPYFEYWIVSCSCVTPLKSRNIANTEYIIFLLYVTGYYSFPSAGGGSLVRVIVVLINELRIL